MTAAQLIATIEDLSTETINAMRDWLLDCYGDEDCQDAIRRASPALVAKAVERDHAGGLAGFLSDYE